MSAPGAGEGMLRMAARLYEARDAARFLLGDGYAKRMGEWAEVIRANMRMNSDENVLNAARRLCESIIDGMAQVQILAAAVEMLEPSRLTPEAP